MYTIDIESALRSGKTLESIMDDMHDAAMTAKAKVDAEKDAGALTQCREDFMISMVSYLAAMGLLDVEELSEEDMQKLEDMLVQLENEMKGIKTLMDAITPADGYDEDEENCTCTYRTDKEKAMDKEADFLREILAKLS